MKVKLIKTDLLKNTTDPHLKYYKIILFSKPDRVTNKPKFYVQALSGRFGNAAKISFLDDFERLEDAESYYKDTFEKKIKNRGYRISK